MKRLLFAVLLCASMAAQAVDITITVTASESTRMAAAVGKAQNLVDSQTPPQPRAATMTEVKQFLIQRAKQLIIDVEGAALIKQASDAAVIPAFDPK